MAYNTLFFWVSKTPSDNQWRPQPGNSPTIYSSLPPILRRLDLHATVVDCAPFIAGAGGLAHLSQLNDFGFTAPASIFRNIKTMTAMHRTTLYLAPLILAFQAAGLEYRTYIPRWSHERELRRDEEEVRKHIDVGMGIGSLSWLVRMSFKVGVRYWAPIDIVMGGALADLLHREYVKAHGF
ncbi:uncharacterized protein RCC_11468 [Ramularia collo-cygni]|uniref:Uncharacterized protein n=1 Tax=Ramularia collo-cygni TaxID=112498 RepID=A0A2D3VQU9_9PEZI|nr:uncharacterized protein RCC_11468 [Ramularia collo-cygni]CZT25799.1 uncharacterized protein RCC_11468 [Ramularia collo-cygni]